MARRHGAAAIAVLATWLAACDQVPPSREPDSSGSRPGRSAVRALDDNAADVAPVAPPVAAQPVRVGEENALYRFSYSYPAEAAAVPEIARMLDREAAAARAKLRSDASDAKREAAADGFEYRPYSAQMEWKVVTDTPRFLSLSSEGYEYTGGAHGMPSYGALLWDKRAGRRIEPQAVFGSTARLADAVRPAFCRAVDAERVKRRGGDWRPAPGSTDAFDTCPSVQDATLLLGSSDRRAIDRIGLILGPYVAGPYSEGAYEITLPVTRPVMTAVAPDYREAIAAR